MVAIVTPLAAPPPPRSPTYGSGDSGVGAEHVVCGWIRGAGTRASVTPPPAAPLSSTVLQRRGGWPHGVLALGIIYVMTFLFPRGHQCDQPVPVAQTLAARGFRARRCRRVGGRRCRSARACRRRPAPRADTVVKATTAAVACTRGGGTTHASGRRAAGPRVRLPPCTDLRCTAFYALGVDGEPCTAARRAGRGSAPLAQRPGARARRRRRPWRRIAALAYLFTCASYRVGEASNPGPPTAEVGDAAETDPPCLAVGAPRPLPGRVRAGPSRSCTPRG